MGDRAGRISWRRRPFRDLRDLKLATFRWVSWWNSKRLHQSLGYGTPEEVETEYYANQAAQAVVTIRAKQKSGHINPPISVRKRMSGPCINARSTTPTFDDNHGPATLSLLFPPSSRALLPAAHKNVTLERHVRVRPAQLREFRIVNGTRDHEPR